MPTTAPDPAAPDIAAALQALPKEEAFAIVQTWLANAATDTRVIEDTFYGFDLPDGRYEVGVSGPYPA